MDASWMAAVWAGFCLDRNDMPARNAICGHFCGSGIARFYEFFIHFNSVVVRVLRPAGRALTHIIRENSITPQTPFCFHVYQPLFEIIHHLDKTVNTSNT